MSVFTMILMLLLSMRLIFANSSTFLDRKGSSRIVNISSKISSTFISSTNVPAYPGFLYTVTVSLFGIILFS